MPRHKSALVALKNLAKSYEQERRALLRKAEDEMAARVQKMADDLGAIAKDFPAVVSNAVASLVLAPFEGKGAPAKSAKAPAAVSSEDEAAGRFRAMGVKAHRAKLGLSREAYGKLVGVSSLTIYQWESGKTKPREAQRAKWLAIRELGKEEAMRRLGMGTKAASAPAVKAATTAFNGQEAGRLMGVKALRTKLKKEKDRSVVGRLAEALASGWAGEKAASPTKRSRGTFKQTAEEMILSLVREKKATTSELVAAWKKAGRGGKVDNTLSRMVADKKLVRKPLEGKRGSEYSAA